MIVICDGLGANEEGKPELRSRFRGQESMDDNLFGLFSTSLSLIAKCLKDYKMI